MPANHALNDDYQRCKLIADHMKDVQIKIYQI